MRGKQVSIKEICDFLEERKIKFLICGNDSKVINGFCALKELQDNSMTWIRKGYSLPLEELNNCSNIVLFAEFGTPIVNAKFPVIFVENVHRTFFRVTEKFFGELNPEQPRQKIEPTAIVETNSVGTGVYIGHHTYVSAEAVIDDCVTIMHNVTIEGKVKIGSGTFIGSGTVIGSCGFGYMTNEDGNQEVVPHYAGVVIGKNVRIGANNVIMRGCLSNTVIEDDVKTADLVCISHNDRIKHGAMITGGTVIAGSTEVGACTWIAPNSTINNNVMVGDYAYIGIGSVVVKDVDQNMKVLGYPAKPMTLH